MPPKKLSKYELQEREIALNNFLVCVRQGQNAAIKAGWQISIMKMNIKKVDKPKIIVASNLRMIKPI